MSLHVLLQIIAIGRNFAEHAKELNNAVPKEPFFFIKPTTSYLANGGKIEIPRGVKAHHESAVVVVLCQTYNHLMQTGS